MTLPVANQIRFLESTARSLEVQRNTTVMGSKLYVGNLSFNTTEAELKSLFSEAGTVTEAALMIDRETGNSRGFAFVTMGSDAEATAAISKFSGKSVGGRNLTVNEARPREEGGGGGRRFGGGGGGGGGRDGGNRRY
jgi:RNA recognition motif-containing protein